MPFRFPTLYAPLTGALLTAAVLVSPSIGHAETRPFEGLEGAWSGSGVIASNDGRSERMRCRAQYSVSGGESSLKLRLQCASDSYHFDASSEVVQESGGAISGNWSEGGSNAGGAVNARAGNGVIVAKIAGPGFTADMRIATKGNHQRVQITPSGAQIKSVSVDMHRG
jgi:hypothetical protein